MGNFLNKFGNIIAGSTDSFTVEERIFNIASFISIIISFLSLVINVQLNLPYILNLVIAIGVLFLIFIYVKSRIFRFFYVWVFIGIAFTIMSFAWLFSDGPNGSINYIYILAVVVFLSISPRSRHFWVIILLITNLAGLYFIYYFFPNWIQPYANAEIREIDILLTFAYGIVFSSLIFSSLRSNYELERNRVQVQKEEIEKQHIHITDSIYYALDIQNALLQDIKEIKNYFSNYFVVWLPKDIVSGDFYFIRELRNNPHKTVVVVGDCTGHGVPGALLTMLGVTFLNEILLQYSNLSSNEILNHLRLKIKDALSRGTRVIDNHDGMDMAICIIDKMEKTIDFAGANRPLVLIRDNQIIELKPDRMPIGFHESDTSPFTNQKISINVDDTLYLFTDGFSDQFRDTDARKFNYANFKNLLIEITDKPLSMQGEILKNKFIEWRGTEEQIDDVLVIGFKPL